MGIEEFADCVTQETGTNLAAQLTQVDPEHVKAVITWWNSLPDSYKTYLLLASAVLVAAVAVLAPEIAGPILSGLDGATLPSFMKALGQCHDKL